MFNKKEISTGYFSKDAIPIKVKITRKIPDGVYVWIELERLGHVFWSIHQGRNITVYTYGRYDDVEMWGFTGEGVLIKYVGSLAKTYIKEKLYPKNNAPSMVYKINDVNPQKILEVSDKLWFSSDERPDREDKENRIKTYGKVINDYNLLVRNCTTMTINVLEDSGSNIFWDFELDPVSPHGLFIQLDVKAKMKNNVENYTDIMKSIIRE
ncbi:hypothetical protein BKK50_07840 [Rodentibacter rarus]|uniref:DUF4105 domain-containing protein n=2 Tax=Rodentibacter rarus TaxID=1908260 RepID=A0A1V3IKJ4_9PAST|nr:hypothetical protein [Rodentibacter rarus]OOF41997.1 hypothetical protein BKK50_07840 [Rodentibacter rarus]